MLFAYQNYLNKKATQGESSESKVPLAQPSKGPNVPTQIKVVSFEPPILIDSAIKTEPINNVTKKEEQQSPNGLSSSNQEFSSPSNEDTAIDNLPEKELIPGEEKADSALNEVLAHQLESEESENHPQINESMKEEIVGLSFRDATDLQEKENEEVNSQKELLEDQSN